MLGEKPTFWLIEFYVTCFDRLNHLSPEDSDVSQLTEGKIIGFDIWVIDYDDDSGLNALYHMDRPDGSEPEWAGNGSIRAILVDGVLLGPGGEDGNSAVQSVFWSRIKAPLEIDLRSQDSLPARTEPPPGPVFMFRRSIFYSSSRFRLALS